MHVWTCQERSLSRAGEKKFVIENELQKDDGVGGKQGFLKPNGRGAQFVTYKNKSMNIITPA